MGLFLFRRLMELFGIRQGLLCMLQGFLGVGIPTAFDGFVQMLIASFSREVPSCACLINSLTCPASAAKAEPVAPPASMAHVAHAIMIVGIHVMTPTRDNR